MMVEPMVQECSAGEVESMQVVRQQGYDPQLPDQVYSETALAHPHMASSEAVLSVVTALVVWEMQLLLVL
jgi:hypothetical protein